MTDAGVTGETGAGVTGGRVTGGGLAGAAITGRTVLLALAGVLAVVVVPRGATVAVWAALVVVLVVVDLALAASPRAVTVERDLPATARLGEPLGADLLVTATGRRRLRGVLRDAWPPSVGVVGAPGAPGDRHRLDVPPGERRRLTTPLVPRRRGDRAVASVVVRSVGPMGLAARQRTLPAPGVLRVLPAFRSRRHLPGRLARLRALDGSASVQLRGRGTEFDSLREYVAGDDVRSIDWRATARSTGVVVRTWRPERDRRVLVVLDTSRTSAGRVGDEPRLDAAMDAALLLAALASAAGDRVDLLAVDRRVRAAVTGVRRTGLMAALVQAMAPLEPDLVEADWALVAAEVKRRMPHRGLLVLLTPLESAAAEESLLPALDRLGRDHQVLVGSVADPALAVMEATGSATEQAPGTGAEEEPREAGGAGDPLRGTAEVHGSAAAQRVLLERRALTALILRTGTEVVDAAPEHLPPRLADAYLALKAAGRL